MRNRESFSKGGKAAGRAWFEGFMSRNPCLFVHQPQSLSVARATSANKETISNFFGKFGSLYAKLNMISKLMLVFNVDETGITVVTKPAGGYTSGEKSCLFHSS